MSDLRKSIDAYSAAAEELYGSDDDYYRLAQIAAATSQELAALEKHFGFPLIAAVVQEHKYGWRRESYFREHENRK